MTIESEQQGIRQHYNYAHDAAVIASNIRRAIKAHPLVYRQEILAMSIDMSPSELSLYMTGKRIWDVVMLYEIGQVLDISWAQLLDETSHAGADR